MLVDVRVLVAGLETVTLAAAFRPRRGDEVSRGSADGEAVRLLPRGDDDDVRALGGPGRGGTGDRPHRVRRGAVRRRHVERRGRDDTGRQRPESSGGRPIRATARSRHRSAGQSAVARARTHHGFVLPGPTVPGPATRSRRDRPRTRARTAAVHGYGRSVRRRRRSDCNRDRGRRCRSRARGRRNLRCRLRGSCRGPNERRARRRIGDRPNGHREPDHDVDRRLGWPPLEPAERSVP